MHTVLLVEGESDRLAIEALADHLRIDCSTVSIRVTDGVHAFGAELDRLHRQPQVPRVVGLYDNDGEAFVREMLIERGVLRSDGNTLDVGFYRCDRDLEDELIRAVGAVGCLDVVEALGDGRRFRTFQHQPEWRDRAVTDQLRRFVGSGAQRKGRYAAALARAVPEGSAPAPLLGALREAAGG